LPPPVVIGYSVRTKTGCGPRPWVACV